jgi:hypothetical protein
MRLPLTTLQRALLLSDAIEMMRVERIPTFEQTMSTLLSRIGGEQNIPGYVACLEVQQRREQATQARKISGAVR